MESLSESARQNLSTSSLKGPFFLQLGGLGREESKITTEVQFVSGNRTISSAIWNKFFQ